MPSSTPNVVSEPLFAERLQPVACARIAEELGPCPSAQDLLRHPLLNDASEAGWRLWLGGQGLDHEPRHRDRTFPAHDLALLAAASGMGIALARAPYGDAFRADLALVPVHPFAIANPESFHVVLRPGGRHPAVEQLRDRLHSEAARAG